MDMLPTMLVYRAGDLEHNWVRVDWEAGRAGVGELLMRYVCYTPDLNLIIRNANRGTEFFLLKLNRYRIIQTDSEKEDIF